MSRMVSDRSKLSLMLCLNVVNVYRYSLTWSDKSIREFQTSLRETREDQDVDVASPDVEDAVVFYRSLVYLLSWCMLWKQWSFKTSFLKDCLVVNMVLGQMFFLLFYPWTKLQIFDDLVRQINRQTPENPVKKNQRRCLLL